MRLRVAGQAGPGSCWVHLHPAYARLPIIWANGQRTASLQLKRDSTGYEETRP
jgi:hypothetical protein